MEAKQAKTKGGKVVYIAVIQEEELEGNLGMCVACGAEADGCEPDARGYECEACGEKKVYGLEELMVMGYARVSAEE